VSGAFLERLQLFGCEDHEVAFFKLVAFLHLRTGDDFAGRLGDVLLLDPSAFWRQKVKAYPGGALGR
jgi:hypothetical protein